MLNIFPNNKMPLLEVKKTIYIVYAVGVLGFLIPFTHTLFTWITPLALLFAVYLLAVYHSNYKSNDYIAFSLIFLLGFVVEAIGVNTGLIFGKYEYSYAMGPKLWGTPLLMGFNWLFLAYCCTSIAKRITKNTLLILLIAPLLLLAYDIVVEQLAPAMNMWSFTANEVPLSNYIAWWIIGTICVAALLVFRIDTKHPLATHIYVAQLLFFLLLFIFM